MSGNGTTPYSAAQRRKAMRLWKQGIGSTTIAEKLGCCSRTIREWAKAEGLARPRAHRGSVYPEHIRKRVAQLYREGRSSHWLSDVYGCSRLAVLRWVRAAGVEVRPPSQAIDHEQIMRVYQETGSPLRTAERCGCSVSGVQRALFRALRLRVRAEMEAAE